MKKFFNDYKQFISRGNIMDLAIAVIIGQAFGKIVSSFTNDIIMPFIGKLIGNINIAMLEVAVTEDLIIKYGSFLQAITDFLIISLFIFLMLRAAKRAHTRAERVKEKLEQKLKGLGAGESEAESEAQADAGAAETAETADAEAAPGRQEQLLEEIRDLLKAQASAEK